MGRASIITKPDDERTERANIKLGKYCPSARGDWTTFKSHFRRLR